MSVLFLALLMSIIVAGCANNSGTAPQTSKENRAVGRGILTGKVMRGPMSAVETKDTPSSQLASGVKLVILTSTGEEIASVVTDSRGVYSIGLPPGTYRIEMGSLGGMEFTKDLPATVTLAAGQETHLDISLDTGIR